MKVNRKELETVLAHCKKICPKKKNTMPILSYVKLWLDMSEERLRVECTDLEVSYRRELTITPQEPDVKDQPREVCVNACDLHQAVKNLEAEIIELHIFKDKVSLATKGSGVTLAGHIAEEYPATVFDTTLEKGEHLFDIDAYVLHQAMVSTIPAMSKDETRYNINGVFFEKGETLTLVSTDGHRMVRRREKSVDAGAMRESFILPALGAHVLRTMNKSMACPDIRVYRHEEHVAFLRDDVLVVVRAVDGKYPDYRRVIPSEVPSSIVGLQCKALRLTAKSMKELQGKVKTPAMKMKIKPKTQELVISASTPEGASIDNTLSAAIEGNAVTTGAHCGYIMEAIKALESEGLEDAVLMIGSELSPIIVTHPDSLNTCIVMPMRFE